MNKKSRDRIAEQSPQPSVTAMFKVWAEQNHDRAQNLDIPDELLAALVPDIIKKIAHNPENVEVSRYGEDGNELSLLVVEKDCPTVPTNTEAWEQWKEAIASSQRERVGTIVLRKMPEPPAGVDRMHAKMKSEVESGRIALSDRILMLVKLEKTPGAADSIFVRDFDGEINQGIGSDFYQNTLPTFARQCGVRFITGLNSVRNIGFFKDVLGRSLPSELKPEYAQRLFPNRKPASPMADLASIQFLYPEDKEEYLAS